MIRRLLILLLIVGCENSTEPTNTCEDDICEVKWIHLDHWAGLVEVGTEVFWTDECEICFRDTTWLDEPIIGLINNEPDTMYNYIQTIYILDGDTLQNCLGDREMFSITHYKNPHSDNQLVSNETGYFIIVDKIGEYTFYPEDYIVFRFEYKD